MRVLYFHQHFTTPSAAGGTRSYELAQALLRRGHAVTMICGTGDPTSLGLPSQQDRGAWRGKVDGIDVIALRAGYSTFQGLLRRTWVFAKFGLQSLRIALREPCDLVFATSTPLTAGIPGIAARWLRRKPFVFEVRDLWPELPRAMGMKNPILLGAMSLLEWASYLSAHGAVGLSPGIVEGIRRRARVGLPIAMVPNACDLDLFKPGRREDLQLPGVDRDDFVAVFTGAHGRANGLHAVLDAAAVLKKRGDCRVRFVFVGDGSEKPELMARAKAESLDRCLFLPPMKKKELARTLGSVDLGLMILKDIPAFYNGTSPNKFFDYISAGLPVLNNYPGWLAEMIESQGFGMAVPPGNPEAFANALGNFARDCAQKDVMATRARVFAEEQFNRLALAQKWVEFLERVHLSISGSPTAKAGHPLPGVSHN